MFLKQKSDDFKQMFNEYKKNVSKKAKSIYPNNIQVLLKYM